MMGRFLFASFCLLNIVVEQALAAESIPSLYGEIATYTGVPKKVIYAVALAESGRNKGNVYAPYPWTLNIAGKPSYFESRQLMYDALIATLRSGMQNIDIGPMQINWHWQFRRIISPWIATDPVYNLKTGSAILAHHYAVSGDWEVAIGKYHRAAPAPEHVLAARAYSQRVMRLMDNL